MFWRIGCCLFKLLRFRPPYSDGDAGLGGEAVALSCDQSVVHSRFGRSVRDCPGTASLAKSGQLSERCSSVRSSPILRALALFVSLLVLWLLMSGIFDNGLILGLGVLSCGLSVWITHRLGLLKGNEAGPALQIFPGLRYIAWLLVEIGRADWAVTKIILAQGLPVRQRLLKVPCQQSTDIGRALFANSITITPGTITVETELDCFIVHALSDEAADMGALNGMGARVSRIERAAARGKG